MASVTIFHSALGRRPAIDRLAATLRDDGHEVVAPDLYAGRVFDDLDAGVAERDRLGVPELIARAMAAVEGLDEAQVYVGFSMGAGAAQLLGATRPGARGVVLVQGGLPLDVLGVEGWPDGVGVQLHSSPGDPWQCDDELAALEASLPASLVEHHRYPGTAHLFVDDGLAVHDPQAAARFDRTLRTWLRDR